MTHSEISHIVKWLYTNDGGYPDKIKWRKAFIAMLEEMKTLELEREQELRLERRCLAETKSDTSGFHVGHKVRRKDAPAVMGMVIHVGENKKITVREAWPADVDDDLWTAQDPNEWELL